MIPSPNLDDRRYADIVEEAIRLIPQYCPEWTNFNPSDPGVTLVELFAWMTEMVLYRLNRVPEKNFLAFLDLMGISLLPPQPAATVLQFRVNEKIDKLEIRRGTKVATRPTGETGALTFETLEDLVAIRNRLKVCVSHNQETYVDNSRAVNGERPDGFEVFGGVNRVERFIYLGDASLKNFKDPAVLTVRFDLPEAGKRELPKLLDWEVFAGGEWRPLDQSDMVVDRNCIAFLGPADIEETEVNERKTFWVRARLVEMPANADETRIDTITGKVEVLGEGLLPDLLFANPESNDFSLLEADKNFLPFGKEPKVDSIFYLCSNEVFAQKNALARIEVMLTDPSQVDRPSPSDDLLLSFEYFNGKRWKSVGMSGKLPETYLKPKQFFDSTACLTKDGYIEFPRPDDMEPAKVNGVEGYWVRCKVERGNYGEAGSWELQGDTWQWRNDNPLRPPSLKSLQLRFMELEHPFEQVVVYNDFLYTDFTKLAATEYKDFQPFEPVADANPALYLGFEGAFPNDAVQLYFHVLQQDAQFRPEKAYEKSALTDKEEQRVVWEYWNGKRWSNLYPRDHTKNFNQAGFVQFVGPKDFRRSQHFGDNLFWLRARLEMGGYEIAPRLSHILLNAANAANIETYFGAILGSSQGTPNQVFRFDRGPVLDGEEIVVRERERPTEAHLARLTADLGADAVRDADPRDGGFLVRWKRVESLYESAPDDRHYVKDIVTGDIKFGDGVRGMIPPKGDRNVIGAVFRIGGGERGNVASGTVTIMKQAIAYVESVTNPFPAMGGCDMETIEEVKQRGPHAIKSRNRAVTSEDFEWLARQASNSVARVRCLPSTEKEGEVTVIVVPRIPENHPDFYGKPSPSSEMLRRVKAFLDERRLVTTMLHVVRPRYAELSVEVTISRVVSGSSDRIKRDIVDRLRRFLHPLIGGRDGQGWNFGRSVYKVDLFHVVEGVPGVDFVERVRIFRADKRTEVEQLRVREDQLVFLRDVEVSEKTHETMI